ncbi:MAG: type II secretion system secretin GspD [Pseudomonadota bacterium]|nr:type II secretion system secretin GspD [Pseudomonadota bacterium]
MSSHFRKSVLVLFITAAAYLAPAAAAPRGGISLNFVNADVESVVKAMGEMTGQTFVLDPRVKGTLNITSPRPVSAATAYDIFLAALRMQGYAAVESGGVVRVLPEAEARYYAVPAASRKGKSGGVMATRVFTLRHESAMQLLPVLKPLVGANSAINAEAGSNSLVVADYADNLERLARVIENLDVPSADEPLLLPLQYAAAQDMAALIGRLYPAPAAGGEVNRLDVAVDVRSNSLILRGRDRSLISRVRNLVAGLDTPTAVAGNVHVLYLKNAEAVKMAETLRRIVAADSTTPAATAGSKNAAAAEAGAGMVQADPASNALIITAPEAVFNNLKAVVERLDVRRAQVLVEALIVEVSADKAAEFGIQWAGATGADSNGNRVFGVFGAGGGSNLGAVAANPLLAATGFSVGVFNGKSLGVLARALETEAGANILSTPILLTLDNEEARISVGSNVPFLTGQYAVTGSASSASPFSTYERRDVGLTLKVKPQISEGGTVRMQISQEVSKLRPAADPTLSATDKRSIESTVLVDDGQIVVLGGLIDDQVQDTEDRVPLLGDIPGLGHLFRYNSRKHTKTNLMVFLRPQVVRDAATAARVSHARYDYIRGQELAAVPRHKGLLPGSEAPLLKYDFTLGGKP